MKELRFFAALAATGAVAITTFAYQADKINSADVRDEATGLALAAPDVPVPAVRASVNPARDARGRSIGEKVAAAPAGFAIPESRSRATAQTMRRVSTAQPGIGVTASLARRDGRPAKHASFE